MLNEKLMSSVCDISKFVHIFSGIIYFINSGSLYFFRFTNEICSSSSQKGVYESEVNLDRLNLVSFLSEIFLKLD